MKVALAMKYWRKGNGGEFRCGDLYQTGLKGMLNKLGLRNALIMYET